MPSTTTKFQSFCQYVPHVSVEQTIDRHLKIHNFKTEPGVAQWLTHCATSWKVLGSIPGGSNGDFFHGIRQFHVPGVDSAS
jgi:hypothetical protein